MPNRVRILAVRDQDRVELERRSRSKAEPARVVQRDDAPRPGGPVRVLTPEVTAQILADTVTPPPEALQAQGLTHWSARRLADWLAKHRAIRVSHDRIAALWRKFGLQPHRSEGFKFSTDPELEAKIRDVVGLYLDPPKGAVVSLCRREVPDPGLSGVARGTSVTMGKRRPEVGPVPCGESYPGLIRNST